MLLPFAASRSDYRRHVLQRTEVKIEETDGRSISEWRNWAELHGDILLIIFEKIAAAAILFSAQFVCKQWRHLSHEPELWRCIDLRMYGSLDGMVMVSMTKMAVDRSEGCVEELYLEKFTTDDLMIYIAGRATRLQHLHLRSVGLNEETLAETLRKFPLLEELEMSYCSFSNEVVERVGPACPQLKSFRLDQRIFTFPHAIRPSLDATALAIAKHFKQLRCLRLFANSLTSVGLSAILDNCPNLEYLDIRCCFHLCYFDKSLKSKCSGIKVLRLAKDPSSDCELPVVELETVDSDSIAPLSPTESDREYSDYEDTNFDYYGYSDYDDFL